MQYLNNIGFTIDKEAITRIITSIIVVIISLVLYHFIKKAAFKGTSKKADKISNRSKTYLRLLLSIIRYAFIIITLLIVLQINNVNVTSMLAGVGILGVIIGLAVQDALKDIIRGISILSDNYFSVGDIVKYDTIALGKVTALGLKTTKIQDIATNNILSVANRNIEKIEVVSEDIYINIPLPYELKVEKAESVITGIIEDIKKNDKVKDASYLGINNMSESSIDYLINVKCNPGEKLQVRRDSIRCILIELEKNDISVPYNQLDIHTK